jgi:micrococcal nuclease
VTDGDTVVLDTGQRVRLVQIDTPEVGTGECYSRAARTALLQRVPVGSVVALEGDPSLDAVDRYGRLLRYLVRGATNVNIAMVRSGAAAPYFYRGERGRYAEELLGAAIRAKASKRGLWGACPGTVLDPNRQVETSQAGSSSGGRGFAGGTGCDPAYPGVCIPSPPPDLDCQDVRYTNFAVRPPDPHGFDGDHDGHGCES